MYLKLNSYENTTPASSGNPVLAKTTHPYWLNSDHIVGFCTMSSGIGNPVTEIRTTDRGMIYVSETPEQIVEIYQASGGTINMNIDVT